MEANERERKQREGNRETKRKRGRKNERPWLTRSVLAVAQRTSHDSSSASFQLLSLVYDDESFLSLAWLASVATASSCSPLDESERERMSSVVAGLGFFNSGCGFATSTIAARDEETIPLISREKKRETTPKNFLSRSLTYRARARKANLVRPESMLSCCYATSDNHDADISFN